MSDPAVLVRALLFVLIVGLSSLIGFYSFWLGYFIFFAASLFLIWRSYKPIQGRNLLILGWAFLLVAVIVTNVALTNPLVRQIAGEDNVATFSFEGDLITSVLSLSAVLPLSILIGIVAALWLVIIPFFLIIAVAAVMVSRWHTGKGNAFFQAFVHLVRRILGIGYFLIHIKGEEPEGDEDDKARLASFGGPGWLIIYPGRVVVLEHQGTITRAVGAGSEMLSWEEKIKAILPLTTQGGTQTVENVLTRDKIPLNITVAHAAQMESADETKTRLKQAVKDAEVELAKKKEIQNPVQDELDAAQKQLDEANQKLKDLENDKTIGDEIGKCYHNTAILVAKKASKIWDSCKGPVGNNLRDIILTEYFEKLFELSQDHASLEARINERKIAEIEKIVLEKVKKSKLSDGVVLRGVDISSIDFPPEIKAKVNEEVKVLIEERIQQTKARIEESKAKGKVVEARAKAQAKVLEGQGEGEARAAMFREILRELKQEQALTHEQITEATLKLISTMTSVKEMEDFFKSAAVMHQWQPMPGSEKTNGARE
jgi:hypothetical protein